MATILYLKASPRHNRSHSIAVADAFIEAYRQNHTDDEIIIEDLFAMDMPALDGLAIQAKYSILHGGAPSGEEREIWKSVERVIADFKSADKYVMAVPMWNFGIPYRLKQYLDVIIQPGYTFSYSPDEGYKGLVTKKPAFVAYASGGEYGPGSAGEDMDYQRRYLETALRFMGFEKISTIAVEPTLQQGPEVAKQRREAAIGRAKHLAKDF
jgi:FMN-dependent NADH-azoreductase